MKLTPQFEVENFGRPFLIAELGANHNGDMDLARKLILAAKEAGADCVKFQSWSKESVFCRKKYDDNCFIADDYRGRSDFNLEQIVEEFSISEQELLEMKAFADSQGILCTSTPFSYHEADFLVEQLKAPFLKVASMDLNNYPFLDYLARKGLPMVISTGLSEFYEIDRAIRTIEGAGNRQIVILHCVAMYPPRDEQMNLHRIETLQKQYPEYPIGFSDHSLGVSIPLAAVAKGACLLEKHFTLDKTMFGWDHKVSADPAELKVICSESKRIQLAMGSHRLSAIEDEHRKTEFRRSLIATRALRPGDVITKKDIDYKRPGTGIAPEFDRLVIGRTVRREVKADYPLQWEDLV